MIYFKELNGYTKVSMVSYAIHDTIYVNRDLSKYAYIKYGTRLAGESATIYDLTTSELQDYYRRGFKLIKIGGISVLYEKMIFT